MEYFKHNWDKPNDDTQLYYSWLVVCIETEFQNLFSDVAVQKPPVFGSQFPWWSQTAAV